MGLFTDRPILRDLARRAGRILLGSTPSGPDALPNAPDIIAKFSKLWTMLIVWLLSFLDRKFGWGLAESVGDDFAALTWFLLSGYLGWRTPIRTPS